jgi:hypothetical protein
MVLRYQLGRIILSDLQGNFLKEIFDPSKIKPIHDGNLELDITISPQLDWIYYRVGTGKLTVGMDFAEYEFYQLETMPVDGNQGPFEISTNKGAYAASWSNVGNQLAYSDYDRNNVNQLFISDKDGKNRRQFTFFTDQNLKIETILWSPEDEAIGLSLLTQDYHSLSYVISLKGSIQIFPINKSSLEGFVNGNAVLIWDGLGWKVIDFKSERSLRDFSIDGSKYAFFYHKNQISYDCDGVLCIIDIATGAQQIFPRVPIKYPNASYFEPLAQLIPFPEDFPGEINCRK